MDVELHTPSPPGPQITVLFCSRCGWFHEAVGMKPECPTCKYHLNVLTGTKEEIDNRVAAIKIYQEDIQAIAFEATDLIEKKLKELGVIVITPNEDKFYVPILTALEEYSNGNYRSEN